MEKIWIKNYQSGVPAEIDPDLYASLVDVFEEICRNQGDRPAYSNMGKMLFFSELEEKSKAFAAYLQQELKLEKGDRFAIMLPNVLQYPVALFGILRAGLTVVNINPLYTPTELIHQLRDSGAKGIVVLENFAHTLQQALAEISIEHQIVTRIADIFEPPKSWLINGVIKYIKKMVPSWNLSGFHWWNDCLQKGRHLKYARPSLVGSDLAFLQYTGGTTGGAKGAMLTHRNMVANLEQALAWLKPIVRFQEEIIITPLPLYHIFSLTANCLLFMKLGALNVLITNPRDIPGFIKELKKHRFTAITGVNTLYNALLNHPEFTDLDFSHLKIALGGGMAVQRSVAERWQQVTKRPLVEAYGLTETSPAVCINPMNLSQYNGYIGLPVPSTDVLICDSEGRPLGSGEAGELCVRGPQVMKGYWRQEEETRNVLSEDGWLHTGDVATINEQGFVQIVDRKKDVIIVSGFNVYPNEVEDVIAKMSGVLEVAVVGVVDDCKGEQPKAFVVKRDSGVTEAAVIEHCRKYLTAYKVPRFVEFREQLPKTNVGKILRRALR